MDGTQPDREEPWRTDHPRDFSEVPGYGYGCIQVKVECY